jgi:hypothetical protein
VFPGGHEPKSVYYDNGIVFTEINTAVFDLPPLPQKAALCFFHSVSFSSSLSLSITSPKCH